MFDQRVFGEKGLSCHDCANEYLKILMLLPQIQMAISMRKVTILNWLTST